MKCILCQSELVNWYIGPIRDGERGTYVHGNVMICRQCHLGMLNPELRIDPKDYEDGTYRRALGQSDDLEEFYRIHDHEQAFHLANLSWCRGGRALDVGAGAGMLLDLLKGVSSGTTAIEPHEAWATVCARKGHGVLGSLEDVPDGSYDAVYSIVTLEHVDDPLGMLAELERVCTDDGRVNIAVPYWEPEARNTDATARNYYVRHHSWYWTERALTYALNIVGLRVVKSSVGTIPGMYARLYVVAEK